jgi:hypothetical protein
VFLVEVDLFLVELESFLVETVGDNVAVPIPSVDRGRGDPRNILGVILAVENGQYTIGCPSGILKGKYSRHQFDSLVTLNTYFIYLSNLHCCDICYYTKHYF